MAKYKYTHSYDSDRIRINGNTFTFRIKQNIDSAKTSSYNHHDAKMDIIFHRKEGSPGQFSGCWCVYEGLSLVGTVIETAAGD